MRRIPEVAARRLGAKFYAQHSHPDSAERRPGDASDAETISVAATHESVVLNVDGREYALSQEDARDLRDALGDALTRRLEFFRTTGEFREDGCYVVSRRNADSDGHSKVFQGFDHLRRLFQRLPDEFTAEDVGRTGLTGGRRHMLVHHFTEHPEFDCELVSRQPLTVAKAGGGGEH